VRRFHSHSSAAPTGILEGHLKILSLKEVELQDDAKAITEAPEQPYSEYPLIIRSRDGGKEVARLTADAGGNYRLVLRQANTSWTLIAVRTNPKPFTITSNQTVRVDMDIGTGVRSVGDPNCKYREPRVLRVLTNRFRYS